MNLYENNGKIENINNENIESDNNNEILYCHKNKTIKNKKIRKMVNDKITDFAYDTCDKLSPSFYKYNLTPNVLTTFSFIFSMIGNLLLIKNKYLLSILYHSLGLFFDACDGCHARNTYNTTIFGDIYDHITDYITFLIYFYILFIKYEKHKNLRVIMIILIIFGLSIFGSIFGCIEKYSYIKNKFIGNLSFLCNENYIKKFHKYALYTEYFYFMVMFVFTLMLYYL